MEGRGQGGGQVGHGPEDAGGGGRAGGGAEGGEVGRGDGQVVEVGVDGGGRVLADRVGRRVVREQGRLGTLVMVGTED